MSITTNEEIVFAEFPKMARLSMDCIITEKIDGTNAQIYITPDGDMFVGSRTRWITPSNDNFGFARWAEGNKSELMDLGPGRHFGEWWGSGIQRGYGLTNGERRFSLFNVSRWAEKKLNANLGANEVESFAPACCHVVPVIECGIFTTELCSEALNRLRASGSMAAPGFMRPEGVVCFHVAAGIGFKKTLEKDETPKCLQLKAND
jgi:hypothetical protein